MDPNQQPVQAQSESAEPSPERNTQEKLVPEQQENKPKGMLQEFTMSMNSVLNKSHNEKLK